MILFFGTRPGKEKSVVLTGVRCTYCQQVGTLYAREIPNYFHLFWIPLFKVFTSRYAECSHCKKGYYKDEFTSEMERKLQTKSS